MQSSEYASYVFIRLNKASICLNTIKWKCLRYNNNDIIIVTNVIILEFLSARFLHPVGLLLFNLFNKLEHENNES